MGERTCFMVYAVTVLASGLCGTQVVSADPPYWHREIVDTGGEWCSLAFDPNGNPAVVYVDEGDALAYAWRDPNGVWHKDIIPDDHHLGRCTLAFSTNGMPGIAFLFWSEHDLGDPNDTDAYTSRFAWKDGGVWYLSPPTCELQPYPIGFVVPVGRVQVAFDDASGPWVVLTVNTFGMAGSCLWSKPSGGFGQAWEYGLVELAGGPSVGDQLGRPSLGISPTGRILISHRLKDIKWRDYSGMGYNYYETGAPLEPNITWPYVDLAADPNNNSTYGGCAPSLALDPNGNPSVAFVRRGYDQDLRVWFLVGGNEESVTGDVASLDEQIPPDLCLHYRGDGQPGIAFYDNRVQDPRPLKYAWRDGSGVWQVRLIDWLGDTGAYHSLASDANGLPAVAYYDATENKLIYAETSATPDVYGLTLSTQGTGTAQAEPIPDPNLGGYAYGTVVEVVATPGQNRVFSGWLIYDANHPGDPCYAEQDVNNPAYIVMDRDREVDAAFIISCSSGSAAIPPMLVVGAMLLLARAVSLRARKTR